MFVKLREWMDAPVRARTVRGTYVGLLVAILFAVGSGVRADNHITTEAHQREAGLCQVVVSVHESAIRDMYTANATYTSSLDYLRTGESAALRRRVKDNVPVTHQRLIDASAAAVSTTPPAVCKPYLKGTK